MIVILLYSVVLFRSRILSSAKLRMPKIVITLGVARLRFVEWAAFGVGIGKELERISRPVRVN